LVVSKPELSTVCDSRQGSVLRREFTFAYYVHDTMYKDGWQRVEDGRQSATKVTEADAGVKKVLAAEIAYEQVLGLPTRFI
jgi:hypothetical protein